MCGFIGWIDSVENLKEKQYIGEAMLQTLEKRGPDESGFFVNERVLLGHRRLVVVDPKGGKQPMCKPWRGGECTLVYNGELYNTKELRDQLIAKGHVFHSYSDTEVLLTAYLEWGEACLGRLNGIFSFAIWDEGQKKLLIARDPLGVKPIFISILKEGMVFGSEIKALLKHPKVHPVVSERGILELFGLGPSRSPGAAIFRDIFELEPGHFMVYESGKVQKNAYWKLKADAFEEDHRSSVQKLQGLLVDAVERQLVADVPICTFLSGGLDSSAISSIAARNFQKQQSILNTFSVHYEENEKFFKESLYQPNADDVWIDKMSEAIGSVHQRIFLKQTDLVDALDEAVLANDLPGMGDIDSSLFLFCKEIRKSATVALSGECADELFGGYPWFTNHDLLHNNHFPWIGEIALRQKLLHANFQHLQLQEFVQDAYQKTVDECPVMEGESADDRRMREMFYLNLKWFMMTLLNRKDRMSMANSLEVRVPFADYRLVEYAFSIPMHVKLLKGREKGLLREALKQILPGEIIERKKSPYPKTHHPIYKELVKKKMQEIINNPNAPLRNLVDKKVMSDLLYEEGESFQKPWYGQLMTGPQVLAYFIQMNFWMEQYQVRLT